MKFEGERKKKREKLAGRLTRPGFEVECVGRGYGGWALAALERWRRLIFRGQARLPLARRGVGRGRPRHQPAFLTRHERPPVPPLYFEHGWAAFEGSMK